MASSRLSADSVLAGIGFVVIGAFLDAMPARMAGIDAPMPILALPLAYFWALSAPGPLPYAGAFAAGLAHDVITGGPIGVWALGFLACAVVGVVLRPVVRGHRGAPVWLGLVAGLFAAGLATTLAALIAVNGAPQALGLFWQMLFTLAVAPVVVRSVRALTGPAALRAQRRRSANE